MFDRNIEVFELQGIQLIEGYFHRLRIVRIKGNKQMFEMARNLSQTVVEMSFLVIYSQWCGGSEATGEAARLIPPPPPPHQAILLLPFSLGRVSCRRHKMQ